MTGTPVTSINGSSMLSFWNHKYGHVLSTVGQGDIQEQQVVSQNEITLSLSVKSSVDFWYALGLHEFIQSIFICFRSLDPPDHLADNWVLYLGINPVPVHEVLEMFILPNHLMSPENNFLLNFLVFLHYPWVICLQPREHC